MSLGLDFRFHAERTPNPQSLKWVVSQEITPPGVTASFQAPVGADVSPLAARLFAVSDVVGVFLAPGFVTVTKREGREWTDLAQPIVGVPSTPPAARCRSRRSRSRGRARAPPTPTLRR